MKRQSSASLTGRTLRRRSQGSWSPIGFVRQEASMLPPCSAPTRTMSWYRCEDTLTEVNGQRRVYEHSCLRCFEGGFQLIDPVPATILRPQAVLVAESARALTATDRLWRTTGNTSAHLGVWAIRVFGLAHGVVKQTLEVIFPKATGDSVTGFFCPK